MGESIETSDYALQQQPFYAGDMVLVNVRPDAEHFHLHTCIPGIVVTTLEERTVWVQLYGFSPAMLVDAKNVRPFSIKELREHLLAQFAYEREVREKMGN